VHAGPAWLCVMSTMRMPDRAWVMLALPVELRDADAVDGLDGFHQSRPAWRCQ
jgi:hypothetical protein